MCNDYPHKKGSLRDKKHRDKYEKEKNVSKSSRAAYVKEKKFQNSLVCQNVENVASSRINNRYAMNFIVN